MGSLHLSRGKSAETPLFRELGCELVYDYSQDFSVFDQYLGIN